MIFNPICYIHDWAKNMTDNFAGCPQKCFNVPTDQNIYEQVIPVIMILVWLESCKLIVVVSEHQGRSVGQLGLMMTNDQSRVGPAPKTPINLIRYLRFSGQYICTTPGHCCSAQEQCCSPDHQHRRNITGKCIDTLNDKNTCK